MLILLLKSCLVLLNTAVNNLLLIQFADIYMYIMFVNKIRQAGCVLLVFQISSLIMLKVALG